LAFRREAHATASTNNDNLVWEYSLPVISQLLGGLSWQVPRKRQHKDIARFWIKPLELAFDIAKENIDGIISHQHIA
jgi:hypothetical protein